VLLPGAASTDELKLPNFVRRLTWVDFRAGLDDEEAFRRLVAGLRGEIPGNEIRSLAAQAGVPPVPPLVVGRDQALRDVKSLLRISPEAGILGGRQRIVVIRGWPGVGKTTLASALANDSDVQKAFSDGALWASLGERPDLLSILASWGTALGSN